MKDIQTQTVQVHDKKFSVIIEAEKIQKRVQTIAQEMNLTYAGKRPVFLVVLNGAYAVAADLQKYIDIECEITFVKLKSYVGDKSSGVVKQMIGLEAELTNRHVVLVEDIVDSGKTLSEFLPQLEAHQPASLRIFSLLTKPASIQYDLDIHYVGFEIKDEFVIGYGLDYDQLGRHLNAIYQAVD